MVELKRQLQVLGSSAHWERLKGVWSGRSEGAVGRKLAVGQAGDDLGGFDVRGKAIRAMRFAISTLYLYAQ